MFGFVSCPRGFAGHPKHPLSGKERLVILTFELLLKLFVAGIFSLFSEPPEDQKVVNMMHSVFVALLTTIYGFILVFIATCDDRLLGDSEGGMLRCVLSTLSACGLCFAWFGMLMLGGVGFLLVAISENPDYANYFTVTMQSLAWSWFLVWPVVNGLLLFAFGRYREKSALAEKGLKTVDGIDYETLMWWKTNEFPSDKEVIVTNTTPGGSKDVQATIIEGGDIEGGQHMPEGIAAPSMAAMITEHDAQPPRGQPVAVASPLSTAPPPHAGGAV